MNLEAHLRRRRDGGHKLLVPYVTAGMRPDWLDVVQAVADAGADAVEIGMPFSDPAMDGPVIQAASVAALERGTTPQSVFNDLSALDLPVPLAVMTYYNLVYRFGFQRFASEAAYAKVGAVILPDMPMEQADEWWHASRPMDMQTVLLVAPNTPDDRARNICEASEGFVYAIGTLGVTGERTQLAQSASTLGDRLKAMTDMPVLVGIGISTAEQALAAAAHSDGVIVGSSLVRRLLEGESPEQASAFIADLRSALDN